MIRLLPRFALSALCLLPLQARSETYTCVTHPYPPLVIPHGAQSPGLAVEVVEKVFRQMGHSLRTEILPPARAYATMKAGQADCIFILFAAGEQEDFLDFATNSIAPQVFYFYARKNAIANFNGDLASVRAFRIGTARKIDYGPRFESARSSLMIDEAPTIEQSLLKLAAGRVDLVPGNADTMASILSSPALRKHAEGIVILPTPIESAPTYIAFSKSPRLAKLREEFDVVLKTFVASHEYSLLLERYGMNRAPQPVVAINHVSGCQRAC